MSRTLHLALLVTLVAAGATYLSAQTRPALDVVISNGHIIDGTGSP